MSGMSIKFEDEILGILLLNSLLGSWETFKVSITNLAPNDVVSLQMVKGSVFKEEMRRKAQGSSSQSKRCYTTCYTKEEVLHIFTSYTTGDFGVLKMGNDGVTKTRVSFKKHPPSRKSELLELVHSNVCGPLKVKSFSGALYFVTFIDDCSRKLWIYVLKTKDQVLEKFKQFQALVERQSGKKVKCIRFDNDDEYYGPFDVYCRQQGIKHQKTPPKTP
ncbi:hypothetical protein CR513_27234, partial [Mucuna pruriens]